MPHVNPKSKLQYDRHMCSGVALDKGISSIFLDRVCGNPGIVVDNMLTDILERRQEKKRKHPVLRV
jgi:hypothetical protein